jgi:hypothetical protein
MERATSRRRLVSVASVAIALVLVASDALAGGLPQALPFTVTQSAAAWTFSNNVAGPFTAAGFGVDDANQTGGPFDAFNGAFIMKVGSVVAADANGSVDYANGPESGDTDFVVSDDITIGGLELDVTHYLVGQSPYDFVVWTFTNNTATKKTITVQIGFDFGGDSQAITYTSDDDTQLRRNEPGFIVDQGLTDSSVFIGRGDRRGKRDRKDKIIAKPVDGSDAFIDQHHFSVGPDGGQASILYIGAVGSQNDDAFNLLKGIVQPGSNVITTFQGQGLVIPGTIVNWKDQGVGD